jgi:hypothetical protein
MPKSRFDTCIWVLIYGGMLGASLGWFVLAGNPELGWTLLWAGAVVTAIGVVLIFVRSRMGP